MVFSSLIFLFLFLPAVIFTYYLAPRRYRNFVLLVFSYVFYLWGSGEFLLMLIISTVFNYVLGLVISRTYAHSYQYEHTMEYGNEYNHGHEQNYSHEHGETSQRGHVQGEYGEYRHKKVMATGHNLDPQPLHHKGRGLIPLYVAIAVAFNLALLGYFKYSNFFVREINQLFTYMGIKRFEWSEVILPIGISFFTFQEITYIVDVYRQKRRALTSFVDFALYVAMFPQLIAGPIVRFHEISEQIRSRTESLDDFYAGILRFTWGLGKKVLIANQVARIADGVFSLPIPVLDTKVAWLGVLAYTLQIYFDFSAYSDMAIGLGHMFGFRLPENFNRPYSAVSITDFWRRWHMTLSHFFRDYVYIPLGGNRHGSVRTYVNLCIVFLLCGMWHGANWTFILWGAYHGILLIFERATGLRATDPGDSKLIPLRRAITLLLVMVGWVLFRANNVTQAIEFIKIMFTPMNNPFPMYLYLKIAPRDIFFLILGMIVFFLPGDFSGAKLLVDSERRQVLHDELSSTIYGRPVITVLRFCIFAFLIIYSVAMLASGSYNPFIYFQF